MDSLSQIVLGAATGEAAAGRRIGRRALLWGALAGTLPDLDVLASPFLTEPESLRLHRSFSHSLFFAFVAAPLLGWLTARLHRRFGWGSEGTREVRPWIALWFWGMWTHPMLDAFTNYGTQLLWPFTTHPFAVSSVFIIDLAYTLPLLVAVVAAWRMKEDAVRRRRAVAVGLALSTAYLAWGVGVKVYVESVARESLAAAAPGTPEAAPRVRMLSEPTAFSTILWTILVETEPVAQESAASDSARFDSARTAPDPVFLAGTYSLLGPRRIAFQPIAAEHDRLAGGTGEGAATVRWFSKGWYTVRPATRISPAAGDSLDVCDLRFGRTDAWQTRGDAPCIFTFRMPPNGATFRQARPALDTRQALAALWRLTRGGDATAKDLPAAAPASR